jgi:histidinol dehydrogenase
MILPYFESVEDFLSARPEVVRIGDSLSTEVLERARDIILRVKEGGDKALLALCEELDGIRLEPDQLRVSPSELEKIASQTPDEVKRVVENAQANIRSYHENQREKSWHNEHSDGTVLGQRILPLASVGLYVPGGKAPYPSSVLMNAVPARIAGVRRLVVVTPPGTLERSPALAFAIRRVGATEVYRLGGAQAVAALAYGTETIRNVDKIVGPGNIYVAAAKKLVFGDVGIDSIAGPSEIVILADESADPRYVASDLLSQAEHGSGDERAFVISPSEELLRRTCEEIERQLRDLPRSEATAQVLKKHGAAVLVPDIGAGLSLVNRLAPEHLEILTRDSEDVSQRVENAGAVFIGVHSPVPVGDFFAGPNHVLPTGGTARFASPLGVYDFIKRSSVIRYSEERLACDRKSIETFARVEGFEAHARAVGIRFRDSSPSVKEQMRRCSGKDSLRSAVKKLKAYHLDPCDVSLKLDQNENTYGPPEVVCRDIERAFSEISYQRYPDLRPTELEQALGKLNDWPSEGVLIGNGSNELILQLGLATLDRTKVLMAPTPSFSTYAFAGRLLGADIVEISPDERLRHRAEDFVSAMTDSHPSLTFVCSPNNPTGLTMRREEIEAVANACPGLLGVDEAYIEFSGWSALDMVSRFPNMVLLRTFSKAAGLASLRLGYLLAHPELAAELRKTQLPYAVNAFSRAAALAACRHYDKIREQAQAIVEERDSLYERMSEIVGIRPYRSETNFILFDCGAGARPVFEGLRARDILVRDLSAHPSLPRALRVTVGRPEENVRFVRALEETLEEVKS